MQVAMDYERRFGGVARLYGHEGAEAIAKAHFVVVGVGGVGSWVAEALIRTASADITLIDLDNVAESNVNRQIQAMDGNFGKAKIDVLRDRAALINPNCRLTLIEDFVNEENVAELVGSGAVVLDCIDQVRAKAALIAHCKRAGNFVVASGAAGGRVNPSLIKIGDLGQIKGDPLLSGVRYRLRKEYGFPKADSKGSPKPFKVTAVYSDEEVKRPLGKEACDMASQGLACSGYGSGVVVTATIGMQMAAVAINRVVRGA